MNFAQRLRNLMDERGLSNYQLAKDLDIHPTTVANWLDGKIPRKKTQLLLADYFHVSVDYLLGNVNDPFFVLDNKRILDDINGNPATENNQSEVNESPTEEKLKLLARHLDKVPDEQRDMLIKIFESTIDAYLTNKEDE